VFSLEDKVILVLKLYSMSTRMKQSGRKVRILLTGALDGSTR